MNERSIALTFPGECRIFAGEDGWPKLARKSGYDAERLAELCGVSRPALENHFLRRDVNLAALLEKLRSDHASDGL